MTTRYHHRSSLGDTGRYEASREEGRSAQGIGGGATAHGRGGRRAASGEGGHPSPVAMVGEGSQGGQGRAEVRPLPRGRRERLDRRPDRAGAGAAGRLIPHAAGAASEDASAR